MGMGPGTGPPSLPGPPAYVTGRRPRGCGMRAAGRAAAAGGSARRGPPPQQQHHHLFPGCPHFCSPSPPCPPPRRSGGGTGEGLCVRVCVPPPVITRGCGTRGCVPAGTERRPAPPATLCLSPGGSSRCPAGLSLHFPIPVSLPGRLSPSWATPAAQQLRSPGCHPAPLPAAAPLLRPSTPRLHPRPPAVSLGLWHAGQVAAGTRAWQHAVAVPPAWQERDRVAAAPRQALQGVGAAKQGWCFCSGQGSWLGASLPAYGHRRELCRGNPAQENVSKSPLAVG